MSTARNGIPKATIASIDGDRTTWNIEFEKRGKRKPKSYIATTYTDSGHVFLQSARTGRALAAVKAHVLIGEVKAAIAVARQQKEAMATRPETDGGTGGPRL